MEYIALPVGNRLDLIPDSPFLSLSCNTNWSLASLLLCKELEMVNIWGG